MSKYDHTITLTIAGPTDPEELHRLMADLERHIDDNTDGRLALDNWEIEMGETP